LCILSSCGDPAADCTYLKDLSVAVLNYKDSNKHFPPPVILDENGRRMHSWRVLTLPHIEATTFYGQYDLYTAWDDPHNAELTHRPKSKEAPPDPRRAPYGPAKRYPAEARRAFQVGNRGEEDFTTDFLMVVQSDEPLLPSKGPTTKAVEEGWQVPATDPDEVLIVQVKNSKVEWTEPKDIVLTSPVPDWGVPLDSIKANIVGSVLVSHGKVTCNDREATLKLLADRRAKLKSKTGSPASKATGTR
jgi:hypothetical protein